MKSLTTAQQIMQHLNIPFLTKNENAGLPKRRPNFSKKGPGRYHQQGKAKKAE